jgi:RNA polymerase sigma-70 factor, ECF subfamily
VEEYRDCLKFLARMQLGTELHAQLAPSDLVQETLLQAHKKQDLRNGCAEKELAC